MFRVIVSFRSKALQRYFATGETKRLSVPNSERVGRLLRAIDVATAPGDLNLPGLFFHALSGRDKGRYSVRVTGNWRITFAWDGEDATDVDLEDYH